MSDPTPAVWQNRIIGYGSEAPDQLLANPLNFRVHPRGQQDALAKSEMLVDLHPDVTRLVVRFGRWHHHVDYRRFRRNLPRLRAGLVVPAGADEYGMTLLKGGIEVDTLGNPVRDAIAMGAPRRPKAHAQHLAGATEGTSHDR